MLKIGEIRELIRLLDETSVSELKIEHDDMKLYLKKADTNVVSVTPAEVQASVVQSIPSYVPIKEVPLSPEVATTAPEPAKEAADDKSIYLIKSPMVGTFYRSPSPDAPSYVDIGAKVSQKTIVCIVEAMKLMNEIEAEVSGEVVEVLAENGQLVEYGQPLFKIRLS